MKNFVSFIKRTFKKYRARKFNNFVKQFYKENKHKKIIFSKNIWNKNFYWDHYYQSFPHCVKSSNYVPYDYYNYKILPSLNDLRTKSYVQDKNMFDKIFANSGVKLPKTIFRCMNYIFMDEHYNNIDDINDYIKNINCDIIIKQANISYGGLGVEKYIYSNGSLLNIQDNEKLNILKFKEMFNGDFIVQEVVRQHLTLGEYHPHSLNTLKIISYRSLTNNEVSILLAHLRIGVNESFVDNMVMGGLSVGININSNNEAKLMENAIGYWGGGPYTEHPNTNTIFKDKKIEKFDLIIDNIKKLSNIVPYQRLIGWDFSINENGEPVLIESNYGSNIEVLQISNGKPLFGDFTGEVKDYLDKL